MAYTVEFARSVWDDLKSFRKGDQVRVLEAIEVHLTQEPTRQSKSRIKRLRPGTRPPFRLRVDDIRVYYDVVEDAQKVIVYGIDEKERSLEWLASFDREEEP
jgi:mRNA interferase RelE/StbE